MTNNYLDYLVQSETIKGYVFNVVNGTTGEIGSLSSNGCNTEFLIIEFNNGKKLKIDAACSGILENIEMFFEVEGLDEN